MADIKLPEDIVFIVATGLDFADLCNFRLVCRDMEQKTEKAFHQRPRKFAIRINKEDLSRLLELSKSRLANAVHRITLVRLGQLELIRDACEVDRVALGSLLTEALNGLPGLNCIRFQDEFWDPTHDYKNSFRPCDPRVSLPGWTFKLLTNALAKEQAHSGAPGAQHRVVPGIFMEPGRAFQHSPSRANLRCGIVLNQSVLISAIPQLETLKMKLRASNMNDARFGSMILNNLASENPPQTLRTLSLQGLQTTQTSLERLLTKYEHTIRNVAFNRMWLYEGKWREVLKMIQERFSLDTFKFTNNRGGYYRLLEYGWGTELASHAVLVPPMEDNGMFLAEVVGSMGLKKALEMLTKVIGDM
ncbi:uncharacterized protein K452DRAFT_354938 [Aplosporella prunicola CBS 121167]|uniref:F-box domain-containing protein n=1 Tax=Aplosporella prunicola CBS 121167 TaxID=1176127 RepID=A0A6A6BUU4_9PEZI|nr:uncharacterized protein K452DRAFT_354938 [Aplosporella prunicola CBS 121167]KAF2147598.1 hypothetical protein K452DRAFT_354938 [Aplosporella prunicola CBS 121167]